MNYCITRSLLFMGLSLSSIANAQQRQIDLEIQIEEPANAAVIQSGEIFPLVLSVTNHGPAKLLEGDTIFIILPTRELTAGKMGSPIGVGEKYVLATEYELTAPITETSGELELCVQLSDDPSTQIVDNNGNPMLVSYIDPDPSNNLVCHTVTVNAGPSAIDHQDQKQDMQPYPNPAMNFVYIPIDPNGRKDIYIGIMNVSGKTVFSQTVNGVEGNANALEVSTTGFQEGIYIVERRQGANRSIGKFTILR